MANILVSFFFSKKDMFKSLNKVLTLTLGMLSGRHGPVHGGKSLW
ncbi:hypothetical protein [Methylomonas albis]|nr:hypothetical protein [Methylomonas albis]